MIVKLRQVYLVMSNSCDFVAGSCACFNFLIWFSKQRKYICCSTEVIKCKCMRPSWTDRNKSFEDTCLTNFLGSLFVSSPFLYLLVLNSFIHPASSLRLRRLHLKRSETERKIQNVFVNLSNFNCQPHSLSNRFSLPLPPPAVFIS